MLIYGWVYLLLDRLESMVILGNSFLVVLEKCGLKVQVEIREKEIVVWEV
jgi:hypothetical protein